MYLDLKPAYFKLDQGYDIICFKSGAMFVSNTCFQSFSNFKMFITVTVNNNFVNKCKLRFCLSQCDFFILLNLTMGQGHDTVLGYLQSLCEVGPSIFSPRNCSDRHNEWTDIVIHMTNSNFIYG